MGLQISGEKHCLLLQFRAKVLDNSNALKGLKFSLCYEVSQYSNYAALVVVSLFETESIGTCALDIITL